MCNVIAGSNSNCTVQVGNNAYFYSDEKTSKGNLTNICQKKNSAVAVVDEKIITAINGILKKKKCIIPRFFFLNQHTLNSTEVVMVINTYEHYKIVLNFNHKKKATTLCEIKEQTKISLKSKEEIVEQPNVHTFGDGIYIGIVVFLFVVAILVGIIYAIQPVSIV